TLAVVGGVGYQNIEASQHDIARNADGTPVIDPDGVPVPDPSRPRVLTYDVDGLIYHAGLMWRPRGRTSFEAQVGRRYGGLSFTGSVSHQFSPHLGMNAEVFDTVGTFSQNLMNDLGDLPDDLRVRRDPLTGGIGGCVFGSEPGQGVCLNRSLQSIRGGTFRMRGGNLIFSGSGRVWNWGAGANYTHRRYGRSDGLGFDPLGPSVDEDFGLFATAGRRLSRTSQLGLGLYASWFDSNAQDSDTVFSTGANASYSRSFLLDRLQLLAALGLYYTDDGEFDSTVASGQLGLGYTF
ncbi:MAG: preprotein translocase subunit YajC, partial [Pseudomonadota bacterium]|nr:preprotein translocase subunit YajC [Pseudomonadota bacterium]